MEKKTLTINSDAKSDTIYSYDLIQYTSHIHFQHYETGACLKASEVKPKLDKFILSYCKRHNYTLKEECFVAQPDEEKTALNYKIQIYPKDPGKRRDFVPDAQKDGYLGNQNKGPSDLKKAVYYPDGLTFNLIIPNYKLNPSTNSTTGFKTLASLIDHILPAFFLLNCFGARSSKGYGSYAIKEKQLWDYRDRKQRTAGASYLREFIDVYYMIEFPYKTRYQEMPKKAIIISNLMKSGYNMTKRIPKDGKPKNYYQEDYYKGRIFRYFSDAHMGGDKAFIKQKILTGKKDWNRESEDHKHYNEYRFVRAMLGFGKEIQFLKGPREGRTAVISDAKANASPGTRRDANLEIIRFNNPVHFVPNGNYLLIIPTEIPMAMSGRVFNIRDKDDRSRNTEIITPELVARGNQNLSEGTFNLEDFLDMFMNDFNNQTDFRTSNGRIKSPIDTLFYSRDTGQYTLTMIKVGGAHV